MAGWLDGLQMNNYAFAASAGFCSRLKYRFAVADLNPDGLRGARHLAEALQPLPYSFAKSEICLVRLSIPAADMFLLGYVPPKISTDVVTMIVYLFCQGPNLEYN